MKTAALVLALAVAEAGAEECGDILRQTWKSPQAPKPSLLDTWEEFVVRKISQRTREGVLKAYLSGITAGHMTEGEFLQFAEDPLIDF